ncbi:MAG: hypothetical protein R2774_01410 [Saprospiraceae bacterium]
MKDKEVINELKSVAPILVKWKDNGHYKVPEGYFDDFESRILTQIPSESAKERSMNPWIMRVAAVGIVVLAAFFLLRNERNSSADTQVMAANDADIYLEYLKSNPEEFDMDILVESGLLDEIAFQSQDIGDEYQREDSIEIQ